MGELTFVEGVGTTYTPSKREQLKAARRRQVAAYNRAAKKKDMESFKNSTPPVYPQ